MKYRRMSHCDATTIRLLRNNATFLYHSVTMRSFHLTVLVIGNFNSVHNIFEIAISTNLEFSSILTLFGKVN
jgi:hypothetical protein